MRMRSVFAILLSCVIASSIQAQSSSAEPAGDDRTTVADTAQAVQMPAPSPSQNKSKPVYFGGTVGLSLGDYFRISIAPLVGYSLTPKVSVGGRAVYEYIEDKRYNPKLTASNYGASGFARFRPVPQAYAHGELAYMNYQFATSATTSDRVWVPFLLVGGGYVQPISPKASAFVEVLFDVLQDSKSPYERWNPWVRIGVAAGF